MIMVCSFGGRPNLWRPFDETIASLRPRVPADLHLLAQTYVDPVRSAMPVLDQLDAAISDLSAEADQWRVLIISSAAVHTDWLAGCREALRRVVSDGVQLAYGEHLRRARATIDARGYLSAALSTFEALGARPWAIRAGNELRASGLAGARADSHRMATLTAQEHQVAALAASGLTNEQIGERLYLSHRTVAAHLYQIFPRLGITSRAALRDALATVAS